MRLSRSLSVIACITIASYLSISTGQAQTTTAPDYSVRKVETADFLDRSARTNSLAGGQATSRPVPGLTYVALASGLEQIKRGLHPRTLEELKLLEQQQAAVAEKVEQVTVNVQQGTAQGSGVIISENGYVLTAAHVAGSPGRTAMLILSDGTRVEAMTLGMNRDKDAGLLKIKPGQRRTWPHASLGQSRHLRTGQWVVAAGHPGGWRSGRGSVIRVGRILDIKKDRNDDGALTAHTLRTDCPLIGGDSGGPLFTLDGLLIGIHSRIGTHVEDNMHVPVDVFDESWERLKNGEKWGSLPGIHPIIGVIGSKTDDRAVIESVVPEGPAAIAGLEAGDLILSCDGLEIKSFSQLQSAVEAKMPGETLVLKVQKTNGVVLRLPVTVGRADF